MNNTAPFKYGRQACELHSWYPRFLMSIRFPTATRSMDIVIPIMGPTGAGKSTFINTLLGAERMKVGRGLTSCTGELEAVVIEPPGDFVELQNYNITLVDTPGFDDTYRGDSEILNKIADWLEHSYREKTRLAGVIYLHDISEDRFNGTALRSFTIFRPLCGQEAFSDVMIGTTKWKRTEVSLNELEQRELELKESHWRPLLDQGSTVQRFKDSYESAWGFVYAVIRAYERKLPGEIILRIQKELVNEHKLVHETEAGKRIVFDLKELLEVQRRIAEIEKRRLANGDREAEAALQETEEKIKRLVKQIKDSKIPLSRRVLGKFRDFLDRLSLTD